MHPKAACPTSQSPVYADRSDVVGITLREPVRIVARNQRSKRSVGGFSARRLRRQLECIELSILLEVMSDRGLFVGGKGGCV